MTWLDAGPVGEVERRRKVVVAAEPDDIVVWWHDGQPWALANTCIHQDRKLSEGTLLGTRVVCPGHQWAFELATGHCRERDRCQPTFPVKVENGRVLVEAS